MTEQGYAALGIVLLALVGFGVAEIRDRLRVRGWWPIWTAKKDKG